MAAQNQTDVFSAICVSCGMCCDGTLFGKARVKTTADRALAESLDLIVTDINDKTFFELPCHLFEGKCTVYQQQRPHICGAYLCKPLKQLKAGETSLKDAKTLINRALRLKHTFTNAQQAFGEFDNKPISDVKGILFSQALDQQTLMDYRRKYARLYLISAKLFPLLKKISSK